MSLSKKHIPFAVLVVIFITIIGIGIGIAAYGSKKQSSSEPQVATTTFGIPVSNQITTPTTGFTNQYFTSAPQSSGSNSNSEQTAPSNVSTPTPQSTFSVLYPTSNQTLINDPPYHTPLATIMWSSKSANIKNVSLDLRDQTGAVIKTIAVNTANTGNFVWFSDAAIPNGTYHIYIYTSTTGAVINEGASSSFTITSPASSQHPSTAWQTYINPQYGFSFIYPNDFSFSSFNTQYPGTTIVKLAPKLNYYIHANDIETVDASEIVIAARPGVSSSCPSTAETTGAQGYVYGNMDTIQGKYMQFTKVKRNDFGINNQYSRYVDYFTFYKGTCYSFRFTAHVIRLPLSTTAVYQAPDKLENDILRMSANVEQLVLSLSFSQ